MSQFEGCNLDEVCCAAPESSPASVQQLLQLVLDTPCPEPDTWLIPLEATCVWLVPWLRLRLNYTEGTCILLLKKLARCKSFTEHITQLWKGFDKPGPVPPFHVVFADRDWVIWPGQEVFFSPTTGKEIPKLFYAPLERLSLDVTALFRRRVSKVLRSRETRQGAEDATAGTIEEAKAKKQG